MNLYKILFRPYLFLQDPENIHEKTIRLLLVLQSLKFPLPILRKTFGLEDLRLKVDLFGLTFKNPVGLAGGFDKRGVATKMLSSFGFSHIELGGVTLLPQKGRPKPRIFRLIEDKALINRMNFPNKGIDIFLQNLKNKPSDCIIGVNIVKGENTPLEKSIEDYKKLLKKIYSLTDYISINVSCPNTVGLQKLQAKNFLEALLKEVKKTREILAKKYGKKPLILKISPDLSLKELDDVLNVVLKLGIDGIIATNTTLDRVALKSENKKEIGGLSGLPLKKRSTEIIRYIYKNTKGKIPIIGVGGIFTAEDVIEKIKAGASLVQIYTGFVYEGPSIVKNINLGLLKYMKKNKIKSIQELVGKEE